MYIRSTILRRLSCLGSVCKKSQNVLPLDLYFFDQHAQIKNICQKTLMSREKCKNKQYFLFSAQVNYPDRMYQCKKCEVKILTLGHL
jgi:hypothetical protein